MLGRSNKYLIHMNEDSKKAFVDHKHHCPTRDSNVRHAMHVVILLIALDYPCNIYEHDRSEWITIFFEQSNLLAILRCKIEKSYKKTHAYNIILLCRWNVWLVEAGIVYTLVSVQTNSMYLAHHQCLWFCITYGIVCNTKFTGNICL